MTSRYDECSQCNGFVPKGEESCLHCGAKMVESRSAPNADTSVTPVPLYGAPPQSENREPRPDREMAFLKKILSYFRGM